MKYALVTGGSRGIGRAVCVHLAKQGYHVLVNYRSNETAAKETAELIKEAGSDSTLLPFDVSDRESVRKVLGKWHDDNPKSCVEVLVNNAGIRKDNLMVWMKDDEWDDVLGIHLSGFFVTTQEVIKRMIRNKYGRIVNVVSLSGIKGMPGQVNYAAAKAGVIAASKSLAQEIGRKNITVNCVAPGFIKTEMTEDIDEDQFKHMIPARRFGTAEEVAVVVDFLCKPEASYITGEVISVNGGIYT